MKIYKTLFLLVFLLMGCSPSKSSTNTNTNKISTSEKENPGLSNVSLIKTAQLVDKENPLVKWHGRYEYKVGDRVVPSVNYLYHTATGFTVDFYGTSLDVKFYTHDNKNIYFDYAIDDETLPNPKNRRFMLPNGTNFHEITLAENLEEGHHTITCLKMVEGQDGYVAVQEFETDGNFYYRKGIDEDKLKFMFVNASSGSGFGSLAYTLDKSWIYRTTKNSSSLHAYMYLTARRFQADFQFVAASGWGVRYPQNKQITEIIDYCGVTRSDDIEGAKTTAKWDHTNYVPDIIVFHIGGNDTKQSSFELKPYQEACVKLVSKLHGYYPKAKMVYTHTRTSSGSFAISALEEYGAIRDGYLKELITPKVGAGETGENTYGASQHQSIKTHIDASNIITDFISSSWGYTPVMENIKFEDFEYLLITEQD